MAEDPGGRDSMASGGSVGVVAGESGLRRSLENLMDSSELGGSAFHAGLERLHAEHGGRVYSRLLSRLCHLRFEPEEAERHWRGVVEHRDRLEASLGSPVDLRVAVMSFFVHVERRLENPTIIERQLLEQTQAFAYRDELTGLRNYRFFELYLLHEIDRSGQYAWPLSLVLLDVDDFKPFNDRHGHSAGNLALAAVGRLVAGSCRKVDVAARYGGEEFAVIAPSTPKFGAEVLAERARRAIAEHEWDPEPLTVSVGIATFPGDAADGEKLIQRADEALYLAKAKGKNQVQLYGDSRRSHRRIPAKLVGKLFGPALEPHTVTTLDVSEGGLRFACDVELPAESLVDLRLELPGSDQGITVAGRVVQSTVETSGRGAAVRVVELSAQHRRLLLDYLNAIGEPAAG